MLILRISEVFVKQVGSEREALSAQQEFLTVLGQLAHQCGFAVMEGSTSLETQEEAEKRWKEVSVKLRGEQGNGGAGG